MAEFPALSYFVVDLVLAIGAFGVFMSLLTWLSIQFESPIFGIVLGYATTLIEVMGVMPQIYSNFVYRSV